MLTDAEKVAARAFRDTQQDWLDRLNAGQPPKWMPEKHGHHLRHECGQGRSVSFEMREMYLTSPPYLITTADFGTEELAATEVTIERYAEIVDEQRMNDEVFEGREDLRKRLSIVRGYVPAGRFAFIYRQGRCPDCEMTGRSREGRLVDALTRQPAGRS